MSRNAIRIGSEALRINPLRTALSTLGVIIGVGSLVAVLSLGDGMEQTARQQFLATTDIQSILVGSRTTEQVDGDNFPLPDTVALNERDVQAIAALPGVASHVLTAQARLEVRLVDGATRRMALVRGSRGSLGDEPAIAHGRPLTSADTGHAPVVVLTHSLARRLSADGNAASVVGQRMLAGPDTLSIVGVFQAERGAPIAAALVPYPTATALASRRGRVLPELILQARRVEDVVPLQEGIERILATRRSDWRRQYSVATSRARAEQMAQGILIFKLLMGAITGVSLLVGGIGIMNVLLASVSERTREIGIRRAAGATRRDIRLQFLAESVAISGFGSALGIVLGLVGAFGITAAIRALATAVFVQAAFSWSSVLAAAAASLLIGLLFGTYPAHRAAQLSPIDAIRHE